MLLGVSGHSVCLGADDRCTGRVSLMKGLKETLASFASRTDMNTMRRIAAFGCKASLLYISDHEEEDQRETQDSTAGVGEAEEDDF